MKGISQRTTSLGYRILRLHYSADPDKDPATPEGKVWYEESRKGMSDARWRQEHEIDYGALGGQLVFPEFDESVHVQPSRLPLREETSTVLLACDPHPRTAHAFVWVAVNPEGELAVVWSWWPEERHKKERMVTSTYAETLKRLDEDLKPRRRLMDVAGRSFNADEEKSYFDKYRESGIIFQPAKRNRDLVGFDAINEALKLAPYTVGEETVQRPRLTIWRGCGDNDKLAHQLKTLRFREFKGNVTDKDAPEEPEQKARHLVDCLLYILLEKPRFIDPTPQRSTFRPVYGTLGY